MSLRELRAAAASGRCRRHGISAAAAFAQTRVKGKSYSRQGVQDEARGNPFSLSSLRSGMRIPTSGCALLGMTGFEISAVILREQSDRRILSDEILRFAQNDILLLLSFRGSETTVGIRNTQSEKKETDSDSLRAALRAVARWRAPAGAPATGCALAMTWYFYVTLNEVKSLFWLFRDIEPPAKPGE